MPPRTTKFVKETLLQLELFTLAHTDSGRLTTPLSPMGRSARQKLNRETLELTDITDKMDLSNIYRTFHPNEKE